MRAPRRCIRRALNQRFEFGAMDADAACSETHRDSYEAHARDARGSSASPPHWLQPVRRPCFTACFRRSAQQAPLTYKGRASLRRRSGFGAQEAARPTLLDCIEASPKRMGRAEARPSEVSAWFDLTERRDNFRRSMINVTDKAVRQLRILLEAQAPQAPNPRKGLRVQIAKGGCSGLQYDMSLDSQKAGDSIVEKEGVEFLIDSESADYLRGASLDYRDELTGTGFFIENPNAARTCGCGTSF